MKKNIVFIMNPISGTVSKVGIPGLIEKRLDKNKFDFCVAPTEYPGHATELAKKAVDEGAEVVVAVGSVGNYSVWIRKRISTSFGSADKHQEKYRHHQRIQSASPRLRNNQ